MTGNSENDNRRQPTPVVIKDYPAGLIQYHGFMQLCVKQFIDNLEACEDPEAMPDGTAGDDSESWWACGNFDRKLLDWGRLLYCHLHPGIFIKPKTLEAYDNSIPMDFECGAEFFITKLVFGNHYEPFVTIVSGLRGTEYCLDVADFFTHCRFVDLSAKECITTKGGFTYGNR